MLIRKAAPADAERVGDVDVEAFTNSGFGEAHNLPREAQARTKRRQRAKGRCQEHPDLVYVALADSEIVGFVAMEYDAQKRKGTIANNAVIPAYANQGISTQLVRCAVGELKRLGATFIWVGTTLVPAARRVYEKAGFSLSRRERRHGSEWYYYQIQVDSNYGNNRSG